MINFSFRKVAQYILRLRVVQKALQLSFLFFVIPNAIFGQSD